VQEDVESEVRDLQERELRGGGQAGHGAGRTETGRGPGGRQA